MKNWTCEVSTYVVTGIFALTLADSRSKLDKRVQSNNSDGIPVLCFVLTCFDAAKIQQLLLSCKSPLHVSAKAIKSIKIPQNGPHLHQLYNMKSPKIVGTLNHPQLVIINGKTTGFGYPYFEKSPILSGPNGPALDSGGHSGMAAGQLLRCWIFLARHLCILRTGSQRPEMTWMSSKPSNNLRSACSSNAVITCNYYRRLKSLEIFEMNLHPIAPSPSDPLFQHWSHHFCQDLLSRDPACDSVPLGGSLSSVWLEWQCLKEAVYIYIHTHKL